MLTPPSLPLSSVLQSIGIFTFSSQTSLIKEAVSPASLQVATTYPKRAIVVSQDREHMYVTTSGGERWIKVSLPSTDFDETEDLYISQISPDHMILQAGSEVCTVHIQLYSCQTVFFKLDSPPALSSSIILTVLVRNGLKYPVTFNSSDLLNKTVQMNLFFI